MRSIVLLLLLSAIGVADETTLSQMQGRWLCVWDQRDGKVDESQIGTVFEIYGTMTQNTFLPDGRRPSWEFRVHSEGIDWRTLNGTDQWEGIFWLKDDTLVFCDGVPIDNRPQDFGDGSHLIVLSRISRRRRQDATAIPVSSPSREIKGTVAVAAEDDTVPQDREPTQTFDLKHQTPSEEKILAALQKTTRLSFNETPLAEVLKFLEDHHDIPIKLDTRAVKDQGVDSSSDTITTDLSGVSLRSALRLILRDLDLAYIIRDEVLMITSAHEAEEYIDTRVYRLPQSVSPDDTEALVNAIINTIAPAAWDATGGPGSISAYKGALVVSQSPEVHRELNEFLEQLARYSMTSHGDRQEVLAGGQLGTQENAWVDTYDVVVDAKRNQDNPVATEIQFQEGESFIIEPDKAAKWGAHGPDGPLADYRGLGRADSLLSLYFRVGDASAPVIAGRPITVILPGALELYCQDKQPGNNIGQVSVRVIRLKTPK